MKSKDKRVGWFAKLEAGDDVVIINRRGAYQLWEVDKVTPTGRVVAISSYASFNQVARFNSNRRAIGVSRGFNIVEATKKNRAMVDLTFSLQKSNTILRKMSISGGRKIDENLELATRYLKELKNQKRIIDLIASL